MPGKEVSGMKEGYYRIMTAIWKLFRADLETVASITAAKDPRWSEMVSRYEQVEKDAPKDLKRYASDMVCLHVDELERRWRK